jgi:hypothetical protein
MNRKYFLLFLGSALMITFSGCATLQTPTNETLASLPIITYGDQVPEGKDYILYFPAGKPISTSVSIKGTAFAQEAKDTLEVTLKKDIYTYQRWISYDKNNWVKGADAFDFKIEIKVPGYQYPKPGIIAVQMDNK